MITKHRTYLLSILLLSVLLRVGLAFSLGDTITETRGGTYDQISYDALALRVTAGHGFSFAKPWWPGVRPDEPTAFWSYLYTLYLAAVYTVFGHHPLIARLIQAVVVGLAVPWLTYRIGQRLFGARPALIAAGISAIYLYFITYAASLMTEAFYIVGILWIVDVSMRLAEALNSSQATAGRRLRLGIELGLAMGITLLLRQVIGLFLAVLALWFFWMAWRQRWLRQAVVPLAAAALMAVLLCLPFIVRNYRVFGVLAMPNTNVGINFFWSNHPIYGTRFEPVLSPSHGVSYQDLIPPELRGLNDAVLDRALLARGIQFVRDDPGRYLLLSLSRIPVYFQFWPVAESTLLSNAARLLSFGLFLPFMLYGLFLAIRDARSHSMPRSSSISQADAAPAQPSVPDPASSEAQDDPAPQSTADLRLAFLALVLLFMVVYTAIHLASWANVRYRLPVDALWILFAGYALADLVRHLENRRRANRSPAGASL
jgi:hypothetical protein